MMHAQLDWQQSAVLGVALLGGAVAARRYRRAAPTAPFLVESAIIAALYTLWQLAGSYTIASVNGAARRGADILRIEAALRLPRERDVQNLIAARPLLAQACNGYYATMHFTALGIFLVWLFVRHRSRYSFIRNVLVVTTAISLVIQFVPVAPPRLLPAMGFVDVAARYGQSVYSLRVITVDQLAAMPSVHVAWALLIAWGVISCSRSRFRWWVVCHPVLTVFVVVATANHYWLDGIVAAALLLASIYPVRATMRLGTRLAGVPQDGLLSGPQREAPASERVLLPPAPQPDPVHPRGDPLTVGQHPGEPASVGRHPGDGG
jgi:hypothetical protein